MSLLAIIYLQRNIILEIFWTGLLTIERSFQTENDMRIRRMLIFLKKITLKF